MATTFAVNLLHPSILNFQSCILTESLVKELECKNGEEFFETFVSIGLSSRGSRVLGRCCKSRLLDGFSLIQCDSRVEELMFSSNNAHDEEADGKYGKVCWEELELARHLGWRLKMNGSKANSGFDVDEDEPESSVRFNDALCCTSKDIRMLKSSTIKKMRLTVISDAPLSDFLYETNHKMTSRTTEEKSSSFSMTKTFHQQEGEETTAEGMSKFHTPSATGTFCTWKLLREKIRQIFQSYEIHVRSNVLVDLRGCPLAGKKGSLGCPSFSFVFVEECNFRGEEEDAENDIGKVASKTEILINHVHHISHYKRQEEVATTTESGPAHNEDQVFGVENAQKVLTSLIEMQQRNKSESDSENGKCFPLMNNFHSHGLLIAGPSGCGKSLVVHETVKKLRANLLVHKKLTGSNSDLDSIGESWGQIWNDSLLSATLSPTVLLIPRIDEFFQINDQNKGNNPTKKLLNYICTLFDAIPPSNTKLIVVATTSKPFLIPAKLRRAGRLEREVYVGAPTEQERLLILKSLSKKVPSLSKLDLDSVARRTPGYVGQDLIRLAHLAILKSYEEHCTKVAEPHIKYALSRILPSVLQGSLGVVDIQRTTLLDHIAGLHSVKHDLIKAIVWPLKYPHAFRTMGITPPKGILLHSPPGCAKTTLVRAVAASHQTNFLSVSAAELFSSAVGESEKIVADLFHRARMASPCILFIDELEAIVGSRQMSQKKEKTTNESILSMLLTEMDGIGTLSQCSTDRTISETDPKSLGPLVLVVAATNRIDMIDSALIRPGRFDKLIYLPPLEAEGRFELLQICAKTTPFSPDVNFEEIATKTEYYSGADLVNLCREAGLLALCDNMSSTCVTNEHLVHAMSRLGPSLNTTTT